MARELPIDQPFDLERTLRCGQGHRWRKDKKSPGWYNTVFDMGEDYSTRTGRGRHELVWIRQIDGVDGLVEFDAEVNLEYTPWIRDKLCWQFRLDDPLTAIYRGLRKADPAMSKLVTAYRGLRVMRVDRWECLVFFILAGQRSVKDASDKMEDIANEFTGTGLGNSRPSFPTAQDIQRGGLSKLKAAGVARHKAEWILEAATRAPTLNWPEPTCPQSTKDTAINELRSLPGVRGESFARAKTAHCVALFGLGHLDAFPVDLHIEKAQEDLAVRQVKWPHPGYASQFLFIHDYDS